MISKEDIEILAAYYLDDPYMDLFGLIEKTYQRNYRQTMAILIRVLNLVSDIRRN